MAEPKTADTLTPAQRSRLGRIGAYSLHAQGKTNTVAARAAFNDRFERQVDPDGVLDPVERARRAEYARKAYFTTLAAKSADARRKRAS